MIKSVTRNHVILWQILFLLLGTTWLLAPVLNHDLSYRVSLISQYENVGQSYSILFRLGDLLAGLMVVGAAAYFLKHSANRIVSYLLLVIGIGMTIDPIFDVGCKVQAMICTEKVSATFVVHAIETVLTAACILALSAYDASRRKRLVDIGFVAFQAGYGLLFVSQYSAHHNFNTLTQYVYQLLIIVWLAWFCRDTFLENARLAVANKRSSLVRNLIGIWAFVNGLLAIVLSLSHIRLLGRIRGLYFASDTAWLAQHGVVVGVIMIYLSRHLIRGERRARQIFLVIVGIEALKYSVITPNIFLLSLYALTFGILFAVSDYFDRGIINITWQLRVKDLYYMITALLIAAVLTLTFLDRDGRISVIASRSFNNLYYYALHSDLAHKVHLRSVLLADTTTVFLVMSTLAILWILFRPYKPSPESNQDMDEVSLALSDYSTSSEDYFKLWPKDKQYFWNDDRSGFIAYKIVGSVAFAMADPICKKGQQKSLIKQFDKWCRARRLSVCYLPAVKKSLDIYDDYKTIQIGSSALIHSQTFLQETSKDKWWRWKKNRATKQGYAYQKNSPPHSDEFVQQQKSVSDTWLEIDGHEERQFVLGYFDQDYLQQCVIHTLHDQDGKLIAFANQLPAFQKRPTATIDLLRYTPEADDAMPFLLANIIQSTHDDGYLIFDLGFVPFAKTKGPILSIARRLRASAFSFEGLEQFKNKFDPTWQANYLVYGGDLGDLAAVALNLEKAMELD